MNMKRRAARAVAQPPRLSHTLGWRSAAATIRRHALVRDPEACRRATGLPEHVDRHAAARIPVTADAQPAWCEELDQSIRNGDGAVLVESPVIAEARQVELERLALDEPPCGCVIDHEVREIRLAHHGTERRELGCREPRQVDLA